MSTQKPGATTAEKCHVLLRRFANYYNEMASELYEAGKTEQSDAEYDKWKAVTDVMVLLVKEYGI